MSVALALENAEKCAPGADELTGSMLSTRPQVREWLELDLQDRLAGGEGYDAPSIFSSRGAAAFKGLLAPPPALPSAAC